MRITGIIRRVDDLGRIVIPKEIRRQVFGKTDASGEPMEIFIDGENIVLRRYQFVQRIILKARKNLKYCPYCSKEIRVIKKLNSRHWELQI